MAKAIRTEIVTEQLGTGIDKHFVSVLGTRDNNYYVSTCFTSDRGWESMVFLTKQSVPSANVCIETNKIRSWKDLDACVYSHEPTIEEHESFIKNFVVTKLMNAGRG